jgi:hypothetical protein
MKKALLLTTILVLALVALAGCAPGPNQLVDSPNEDGEVAGFWQGLWHGIIAPFTFVISLFSDNVGVYEAHNNGGWYNFGFLVGLSIILGGSGGGGCAAAKRSRD